MAKGRITKRAVEAIPVLQGKRNYLWDDKLSGFGCMVTPAGSRSYLVQYQLGGRSGRTRRFTIGRHGAPWTADGARERAADLLELVRKGVDPMEHSKAQRASEELRLNEGRRLEFSAYFDLFRVRHIEAKKLRSARDIAGTFRRDLTPFFKGRPLSDLTRKEIVQRLDEIGERSPATSVKAYRYLRKMLSWAVERGDLPTSPMEGLKPPYAIEHGERVLSDRELALVWKASDELGYPFGLFVKLLILTGQRVSEVAGMRWDEIDLEQSRWVFAAERSKNKRGQLCPISPQARTLLLESFPVATERVGLVFTTRGDAPISGFSKAKQRLDQEIAKLCEIEGCAVETMNAWKFHDLRRTFATGCQALGFPMEQVEACLNHKSGKRSGLAAVYQLHDYATEKSVIMKQWGATVAQAILQHERGRLGEEEAEATAR